MKFTHAITSRLLNLCKIITSSIALSKLFRSSPTLETFALTINLEPSSLVVSMLMFIDVLVPLNIGARPFKSHSIVRGFDDVSFRLQLEGVTVKRTFESAIVMRILAKYAVSPLFSTSYAMIIDELLPRIYGKLVGKWERKYLNQICDDYLWFCSCYLWIFSKELLTFRSATYRVSAIWFVTIFESFGLTATHFLQNSVEMLSLKWKSISLYWNFRFFFL